ncbi:MAG: response regulator [Prochloraceae cyanobacterium]|nr:response regulator [Prochloraceae cyanobacterium]
MKILLVEDDKILAKTLSDNLNQHHYVVDTVADGESGWYYASNFTYDLILLDVLMPKLDGMTLCQRLRDRGYFTPIILLTACYNTSVDKIKGLNAGADDYIIKPFDFQELIARIKAILRRDTQTLSPVLEWENLCLDPESLKVTYEDRIINLTPKQYGLLELFLRHQGRVFSPSAIIDSLWSSEEIPGEDSVRTHIKELRQKLKAAGVPQDAIATIYGQGYCLKPRSTNNSQAIETLKPAKNLEQIAALAKIWQEYQKAFIARLEVFERVKSHLKQQHTLNRDLKKEAESVAHTLAGTLGSFGKNRASQLAFELENLLQIGELFEEKAKREFLRLLVELRAEIENKTSNLEKGEIAATQQLKAHKRRSNNLLTIDLDRKLHQSLCDLSQSRGWQVLTASSVRAARELLVRHRVDLSLLQIRSTDNADFETSLRSIEYFRDSAPSVPLFAICDRANFDDRLEVMRRGADTFLEQSLSDTFIIDTIATKLNSRAIGAKITIVSEDRAYLHRLSNSLANWQFQTTIVDEPTQFWDTFVELNPDLLILDLAMTPVDAIELCRVVRSDPRWYSLPILFLTNNLDPQTQALIYTSGADCQIPKSISTRDLAHYISDRLNRI